MSEVFRGLIYGEQVSLTLADTTALVNEGARIHGLTPLSTRLFGKILSVLTFMSSGLKEKTGELSLAIECAKGKIEASGNRALHLRGYMQTPQAEGLADGEGERAFLGEEGAFTLVRDDGYSRPFVGACAFPKNAEVDSLIEEYYRVSEQLPTRVATVVEIEGDACVFAGVIALQPLPFADEETLKKVNELPLEEIALRLKEKTPREVAAQVFSAAGESREAKYRCRCSREYLLKVLVTLGEGQLREIALAEGAVRAHCHYCNTDYAFTNEDIDALFKKDHEKTNEEN